MNPSWRSLSAVLLLLLGLGSGATLRAESAPVVPAPTASATATSPAAGKPVDNAKEPWRAMTKFNFAALPIGDMPPDDGNIAPIADADAKPVGLAANLVKMVETTLPAWAPGHVADPVQRVRNHLFLLGAPDFGQSPAERFLAASVLRYLLTQYSDDELAQILCWIALHPDEGTDTVLDDKLIRDFGLPKLDRAEVRLRTYYYAVKLNRWVVGW
jgi:hypothetical protein